jgi:formate dehydrogenase major subunit
MDLQNSDAIVFMGSNMAECHPCGFKWPMKAKAKGATLIHVDPRFTRTSAMCDMYVPIRSGTDIAFLGGLVNYILTNKKYFEDYVLNFTNAPTLINAGFKDTEDNDGFFSGFNATTRAYDRSTWQYQTGQAPARAPEPQSNSEAKEGQAGSPPAPVPAPQGQSVKGVNFAALIANRLPGAPLQDKTLNDPNTVFQILKRHYSRYTPEMVEKICGTPKELFIKVADTLIANSGRDKTSAFVYAVGWTQHTTGVQLIRTAGLVQLLLGNIGRPGGGIMALRGHASIQGSTDIPSLYNLHPGYLNAPDATKTHDTLLNYILTETQPTSFWSNTPAYVISQLRAWFGDAGSPDNDYFYDSLPKITGDHSHFPVMVEMSQGKIQGMILTGQNPATSLNAAFQRNAMAKLKWLVVLDFYETESSVFWKHADAAPADIQTEVFFLPAAHIAEKDGSMTQTQRTIQYHHKTADPPGDARSDLFFWYDLGQRLKKLYAAGRSGAKNVDIIKNMTLDYAPDPADVADWIHKDEPSAFKIFKEINGFDWKTKQPINSFANLLSDGSTAAGAWIYTGQLQLVNGQIVNRGEMQPGKNDGWVSPNWGWAWPANRHQLYNRASADPKGDPWSAKKKYTYWDAAAKTWKNDPGDGIDFTLTKDPSTPANPNGVGVAFHSGSDPFLLKKDGKGWLFAYEGLSDGPLPTHYEPWESPVKNQLYKQDRNPVAKIYDVPGNKYNEFAGTQFPTVITTYRLTEHHLSGTMTRWLPWLAELMPELFVEISPELAKDKGIANGDYLRVITERNTTEARALVTKRLRPLTVNGQVIHQVGMPWHWGYQGIATGDIANNVTALVADPNVSIHEGKAFTCRIEKGRARA